MLSATDFPGIWIAVYTRIYQTIALECILICSEITSFLFVGDYAICGYAPMIGLLEAHHVVSILYVHLVWLLDNPVSCSPTHNKSATVFNTRI